MLTDGARLTRVRRACIEVNTAVWMAKDLTERQAIPGRWYRLFDAELPGRR